MNSLQTTNFAYTVINRNPVSKHKLHLMCLGSCANERDDYNVVETWGKG